MGLYIQSLTSLPLNQERDYYIYLLDYGWTEPLSEALSKNYKRMTLLAEGANAVIIRGTKKIHFEDEVLSWHHVNGEKADELLPAILITNRHPHVFKESYGSRRNIVESNLKLILIPLKLFCTNTRDVSNLIDKLFVDIIKRKDLSNFKIAKEIEKGKEAKADAIILEPNGGGEGLDYTEMLSFLKRDEIIENLKNKLSCLTDPTRLAIENGIDEFYRRNYINCVRILFPSIEEITNQMLQAENINPTSFSGLADKLTRLKELGKVDDDLVQSIKISTARNAVLHGNYNPNKQELVRPLCYSSMTFLTELIK